MTSLLSSARMLGLGCLFAVGCQVPNLDKVMKETPPVSSSSASPEASGPPIVATPTPVAVPTSIPATPKPLKADVFAGSGKYGYKDGPAKESEFIYPYGLTVDKAGTVYVSDQGNHRIRKISTDGMVSTVAGSGIQGYKDGENMQVQFNFPKDVAIYDDKTLFVADIQNDVIRQVSLDGGTSTLAGNAFIPADVMVKKDGKGSDAQIPSPESLAINQKNIYVSSFNFILKIDQQGNVTTYAGADVSNLKLDDPKWNFADGPAIKAHFISPSGLALDKENNLYFVEYDRRIRRITPAGWVETVAGKRRFCDGSDVALLKPPMALETFCGGFADGPATQAVFQHPDDVALDNQGNIYVADNGNEKIRKITPDHMVSTLLDGIRGCNLAMDPQRNILYISECQKNQILKVAL